MAETIGNTDIIKLSNGGDIRHLFRTSLSEGFSGQASDDDATDF